MKLDEIVAWYQKKIGTYDKQQWEKTVEQRILDGFSSLTLKTAKLKTELIDVDLVRGSTFPKAKSKQSLLTVIRLAILRYFFLPVYAQWWVKQTSANGFAVLLVLYVMQMVNWAVYMLHIHRVQAAMSRAATTGEGVELQPTAFDDDNSNYTIHETVSAINNQSETSNGHAAEELSLQTCVSLSELFIPMGLSLLLSLIHSQIVATNTVSGSIKSSKRRRISNTGQSNQPARGNETQRTRRRKRLVKVRSYESTATPSNSIKKPPTGGETITSMPVPSEGHIEDTQQLTNIKSSLTHAEAGSNVPAAPPMLISTAVSLSPALKLDLKHTLTPASQCGATGGADNQHSSATHKKRNVNWHSPIHNYATETMEKQQQTSPQAISSTSSSDSNATPDTASSEMCKDIVTYSNLVNVPRVQPDENQLEDNQHPPDVVASEGGVRANLDSPTKYVRIDECVQEFYNDLINHTAMLPSMVVHANGNDRPQENAAEQAIGQAAGIKRNIGEDDGFESLNGKSSSGDETNSPLPTTSAMAAKNQLRLRLNVNPENRENETLLATTSYRRRMPLSSESDYEKKRLLSSATNSCDAYQQTKKTRLNAVSSEETEEEGDDGETISSPASVGTVSNYNECTTSATEWLGVTTNSEECSYSSEMENSDHFKNRPISDEDGFDIDFTPTTILNPHGTTADRISCAVWDHREIKKAQMSVLEISSCIIERVESMPETNDYIYIGMGFSILLSLIPSFCRLCEATMNAVNSTAITYFDVPMLLWEKASFSFGTICGYAFGSEQWERTILVIGIFQRLCLTTILFIIFAVAERTFKQRFLYAKLFSHLTSSRRARKSNLPHFRLNKVRNIKTWLSVRSYLKKRGPQRSVDVIVSAAFIVTMLLLAFLSVEWLKDSVRLHSHLNLEALMWSAAIGIFLLRFMTLGNKIHQKYCSISVLITEQINLYLQIEQKPKKKDELMVANSVLKLAADLLKELEAPFKISGLSANPYLFTTIKVVILSALSGVLSEMLGFKLKLHKIKIK